MRIVDSEIILHALGWRIGPKKAKINARGCE